LDQTQRAYATIARRELAREIAPDAKHAVAKRSILKSPQ
jgi:hypothetical protein